MNAGLGVRPELFAPIFAQLPSLGFFEAHSENYFGDSIARSKLIELRRDYPISLHGVGLSLGRADNLDQQHLLELKKLAAQIEPMLVSEHLAWSAYSHTHLPDLLPLPLNSSSLAVICSHIEQMQDVLQRQILLENPSNYLLFDQLQIPEPEFLNAVAQRTGCGLLVDINNIYVSSKNLQRDPHVYLKQLNSRVIGQYHLAGHTKVESHKEPLLIDTHNQLVLPEVWHLYGSAIEQHGEQPTIIEWDSDFPEFSVLLDECLRADAVQLKVEKKSTSCHQIHEVKGEDDRPKEDHNLAKTQINFLNNLLIRAPELKEAIGSHRHRFWVYQNNVFSATQEYLEQVYPAVRGVVGDAFFRQMAREFIRNQPPATGNIYLYGQQFGDILAKFQGLNELPYLADLIAYEWALHEVYFSSINTDATDFIDLTQVSQEDLLGLAVTYNASVRLLVSDYPIFEIHRQSLPDFSDKVAINLQQSRDHLLVCKQKNLESSNVITKVLSPTQSVFLTLLGQHKTLQGAIDACQSLLEPESISAVLALVFELNLLSCNNNQIEKKE